MTIHPEDAARALREAEAAADRSNTAVGYARSGQHLILWGVIWAVGNVAGFLRLPLGPMRFRSSCCWAWRGAS